MVRRDIIIPEVVWEERITRELASFSRLAYPCNQANKKKKKIGHTSCL